MPHDIEWGGGFANCKEGETLQMPFVIYTKIDREWLHSFYSLGLIIHNYIDNVKKQNLLEKSLNDLSRDEILNILTYYIRQDRFCEGLLAGEIKSGKITKLVKKLHEITKT